jgi:hypothetical protein
MDFFTQRFERLFHLGRESIEYEVCLPLSNPFRPPQVVAVGWSAPPCTDELLAKTIAIRWYWTTTDSGTAVLPQSHCQSLTRRWIICSNASTVFTRNARNCSRPQILAVRRLRPLAGFGVVSVCGSLCPRIQRNSKAESLLSGCALGPLKCPSNFPRWRFLASKSF